MLLLPTLFTDQHTYAHQLKVREACKKEVCTSVIDLFGSEIDVRDFGKLYVEYLEFLERTH